MIEINLLPEEVKAKVVSAKVREQAKFAGFFVMGGVGLFLFIHLVLGVTFIVKSIQTANFVKQKQNLEEKKKELGIVDLAKLQGDARTIQQLARQRIVWAQKLNALSLDLPYGIWFNELAINGKELSIKGSILSTQKQEINLIHDFINILKNDKLFFTGFNSLTLGPLQRKNIVGHEVLDFILTCS